MSQLLAALINANEDELANIAPRTIGGLVLEGRANAGDLSRAVNSALGADTLNEDEVNRVLDEIDDLREPAKVLTFTALSWVVGFLEDGNDAEARRVWLEREATFEERQAAITAAGDAVQKEREQRDAAFDAFVEQVRTLGTIGLKVLATLALGAIGI